MTYNNQIPGARPHQVASAFFMDASTPDEELDSAVKELMTYQPWAEDQIAAGDFVRNAISEAYKAIVKYVPASASRTIALQHLIDARLRANAAITFKGKY